MTNVTMAWLREKFGERLINYKAEVKWVLYSSDLNPQDFFLGGFLKNNIEQGNPHTITTSKHF